MACLEIIVRGGPIEARELEILGRDPIETWVRLPARAVLFGRRWSPAGPQLRTNDGTLAVRHCELVPHPSGFAVRDLRSSGGTFINQGRLITSDPPHVLVDGDAIRLGGSTATFHAAEPSFAFEPLERELAIAVRAGVDGSRIVYADWLEQRGDLARATFLRQRDELARARTTTHESACLAAIGSVDPGWRLHVLGNAPVSHG